MDCQFIIEVVPRLIYMFFSVYALAVVVTRWQASRVMTQDRRFLLLFFIMECVTTLVSGFLKIELGTPTDMSVMLTILTQSFLAAYLHHSIPAEFRRVRHHWTRRR